MNPREFLEQTLAEKLLVRNLYQRADKALGGWLPGGGTGNPLSKPVRQIASVVDKAPVIAAKELRDRLVVPVIDKGIETGVLPPKETMFLRYLSGTEKPLTVYPDKAKEAIRKSLDDFAIKITSDEVDQIYKKSDPAYRQLMSVTDQLNRISGAIRDKAEMTGISSTPKEISIVEKLRADQDKLARRVGARRPFLGIERPDISDEERLKIIREHNLFDQKNFATNYDAAYHTAVPTDIRLSLGRFAIKDNVIQDRYKFDDLEAGRSDFDDVKNVYPDAAGGGTMASNLIEFALKAGLITPRSGYDIKIPFR